MSDDITFCGSECNNKKCFRHPSNIREPRIPHSFAYLKDTEDCPMKKQEVRLIDANALLKSLKSGCENCSDANTNWCEHCCKINDFEDLIDNAPTVKPRDNYDLGYVQGLEDGRNERPQGTCKTCRCRDPEDKKCDCGALERQGCPFPVSDGYYCKYYEEGGAV